MTNGHPETLHGPETDVLRAVLDSIDARASRSESAISRTMQSPGLVPVLGGICSGNRGMITLSVKAGTLKS